MSTEKVGLCPPGIPLRGQVTTATLKAVLKSGATNGQSVETLAFLLDTTPRAVRKLSGELIEEGTPVCSHPKTGYYLASTWEEIDATAEFLRSRGLSSLAKAKQLRDAFAGVMQPQQSIEESGAR